jgi:hypothetical protein
MKMDEYLSKKKQGDDEKVQRMSELEEAEKRAKEIRETMKAEKKMHAKQKMENFSLFGMKFRSWTLNDICIILFFIAILVIGGLVLMPGNEDVSDISSPGFFTKLFKGIAGLSVTETNVDSIVPENTGVVEENPEVVETDTFIEEVVEKRQIDFRVEPQYKGEFFTTINNTGESYIWYNIYLSNTNSFNVKCNIYHYVGNSLKDQSSVNVLANDDRSVAIRELSDDSIEGTSKVKLDVKCFDENDVNSETTKTINLKFYFI